MIVSRKMAEQACETLGWGSETLDGGITPEGISSQYRLTAKRVHPDTEGGSMEEFVAVDRAKHVLLEWLKRQPDAPLPPHGGVTVCPRCEGRAYIMSQRAFRAMRVQCPTCRGAGEIGVEQEKEGDRF
jgi:DnaJ-class molecular chaperone